MKHYIEMLSTKLTCKNNGKGESICSGIIGDVITNEEHSSEGKSIVRRNILRVNQYRVESLATFLHMK